MKNNNLKEISQLLAPVLLRLNSISDFGEKVDVLNEIRRMIHNESPFSDNPVDCVLWAQVEKVEANDYNPNHVAPVEYNLLGVSVMHDGFTQPIVTSRDNDNYIVVDGFHRTKLAKEDVIISSKNKGYAPIVLIRNENESRVDRISSTIRHNRARGKHSVTAMSEIIKELKSRGWSNRRVSSELGVQQSELIRLIQVSRLEHLVSDEEYSCAWESIDLDVMENDITCKNVSNGRVFHPFTKWECISYGMYDAKHATMTERQCKHKFIELMTDIEEFKRVMTCVITEWKYSCEHHLTSQSTNKIAWIGQAALAYKYKVPCRYSNGWNLLSKAEQRDANNAANDILNKWTKSRQNEG